MLVGIAFESPKVLIDKIYILVCTEKSAKFCFPMTSLLVQIFSLQVQGMPCLPTAC